MARQEHTDDQVLDALRVVAAELGEPLSAARYDSSGAQPSSSRVVQRFGSWNAACTAAGLATRTAGRRYSGAFDAEAVTTQVVRFLEAGGPSSYAAYAAWARTTDGAPSGQTVRNVLGGWSDAVAAARERMAG